jgi:hypothetical protein
MLWTKSSYGRLSASSPEIRLFLRGVLRDRLARESPNGGNFHATSFVFFPFLSSGFLHGSHFFGRVAGVDPVCAI